jgi:hypothetical protein
MRSVTVLGAATSALTPDASERVAAHDEVLDANPGRPGLDGQTMLATHFLIAVTPHNRRKLLRIPRIRHIRQRLNESWMCH